jgi:hypothetical protein
MRFEVLPGAPRLVVGAPRLIVTTPRLGITAPRFVIGSARLVASAPRCCQLHLKFPLALYGVPKLITFTPVVLLYQLSRLPATLKAARNALLRSDTFLKLMHLSSHSSSSQTYLEASSD